MQKLIATAVFFAAVLASTATAQEYLPDGVSMDCINATVRIWRPVNRTTRKYGSGFIFKETDTHYVIMTNHHVAEDSNRPQVVDARNGTVNQIDSWNVGNPISTIGARTGRSYYNAQTSRDIAVLMVPKSSFPGRMPVIPLAPVNYELKVGDPIITIGCSDGRHPRARVGRVLKLSDQFIWYDPTSIGGDSGSAVFTIDGQFVCGQTAWSTPLRVNGQVREVGLAVRSNFVLDVMSGRTGVSDTKLPPGTKELRTVFQDEKLPVGARLMPTEIQADDEVDIWRNPGDSLFRRPIRRRPQPEPQPLPEPEPQPLPQPSPEPEPQPLPEPEPEPEPIGGDDVYVISAPRIEFHLDRIADAIESASRSEEDGLFGLFRDRNQKPPQDVAEIGESVGRIEGIVTSNSKELKGIRGRIFSRFRGDGSTWPLPTPEEIEYDYAYPILGRLFWWLAFHPAVWAAVAVFAFMLLPTWFPALQGVVSWLLWLAKEWMSMISKAWTRNGEAINHDPEKLRELLKQAEEAEKQPKP